MEAAAAASKMLSSSLSLPPRTQLKQFSPPPPSALKLYDPAAPAHSSVLATSLAQHFPTSVLIQEQRRESKPLLQTIKDDKTSQVTADGEQRGGDHEVDAISSDQYLKEFQCQLLQWPALWFPSSHTREKTVSSLTIQPAPNGTRKLMDVETEQVLTLAKRALSASKEAASLVDDAEPFGVDLDNSITSSLFSLGSMNSSEVQTKKVKFVKSTRLLERQSKRRKGTKSNVVVRETSTSTKAEPEKRTSYRDSNLHDPLRMFLARPVTRELLSSKEELELIAHIKAGMQLEEARSRFRDQFRREPTLVEWAEAASLSCHELKSRIHRGTSSREKLICANLRMVVYIAKQYRGRGLDLQDLMQEGSMGLMRSVLKFKPQAGCRFATYAYWWIRQSIRRAIFQNSKLIRLPEGVYNLMYKVSEAKRICIREGNHEPTQKQIAAQAGMPVEKVQKLRSIQKITLSLQQPIWPDDSTTYEEITADTTIDSPDTSASKQLMRNHISNLLSVLNPKERKVIRLRYGIGGEVRKSLADIGIILGVSKERIRQLESRSLFKLKQHSESQGLTAYKDLLV